MADQSRVREALELQKNLGPNQVIQVTQAVRLISEASRDGKRTILRPAQDVQPQDFSQLVDLIASAGGEGGEGGTLEALAGAEEQPTPRPALTADDLLFPCTGFMKHFQDHSSPTDDVRAMLLDMTGDEGSAGGGSSRGPTNIGEYPPPFFRWWVNIVSLSVAAGWEGGRILLDPLAFLVLYSFSRPVSHLSCVPRFVVLPQDRSTPALDGEPAALGLRATTKRTRKP